jgi:hypothetical protein
MGNWLLAIVDPSGLQGGLLTRLQGGLPLLLGYVPVPRGKFYALLKRSAL